MKNSKIKVKSSNSSYSIIIGRNAIQFLSKRLKAVCPKTKKIVIIIDKKSSKKI